MASNVIMPQLGESVTEGTITRWLKNVGDTVAVDEAIVEVSTDKVDTEIPSPVAGVILEIKAEQDAVVLVGGVLAIVGESNSSTPAAPAPVVAAPVIETPKPAAPVAATPTPVAPVATATSGSTVNVILPQLGESVSEGTITRWLKNVGDAVAIDEAIVEISTDKVDTEIPSPVAGFVSEIKVAQDEVALVGAVIATISTSNSAPTNTPTPAAPTPVATTPAPVATPSAPAPSVFATPASNNSSDAYVTPLVRQLAREKGVDLSTISGTGIGGRIRKQDVMAFSSGTSVANTFANPVAKVQPAPTPATPVASSPAPAKPAPSAPAQTSELRGRVEQTSRLRRVIAERMVESLHISAQLTSVVEVDVTKIAALRNKVKNDFAAREGVKLSFLPFFAKATIETLKQYPVLNATISADATQATYHDAEHLAVAVDTERGLLVPVIRDAGDLSIAGLARKIQDVALRTRDNKVTPDELSGGTFTLTNTGSRGALFDTPIINQPQVGILGTGAVVKRPIVVTGEDGSDQIAIRQMVYLALTYDHRLVDGADAARFLSAMKLRLEEANFEAELGLN